jgi:hypothetical protein
MMNFSSDRMGKDGLPPFQIIFPSEAEQALFKLSISSDPELAAAFVAFSTNCSAVIRFKHTEVAPSELSLFHKRKINLFETSMKSP